MVGSVLTEILIGVLVLAVAAVWYIYRLVRGLIAWSGVRSVAV
ncbi:MAG: hypothetical protein WEC99_06055 [Halofilum sp. (in: g-proteobacteria)]